MPDIGPLSPRGIEKQETPKTSSSSPSTPSAPPASALTSASGGVMTASQLADVLKGLSVGQESNPTGGIASRFAQSLSSLPADQAASVMKALSGAGQFGTDVETDLSGKSNTPNNSDLENQTINSYLSSLTPYISDLQKEGESEISGYGTALQSALKGASPQLQQAYASSIPAMQQAMSLQNTSAAQSALNMPAFEALLQGLTTEAQNQKAAGYYAIEEPYVAATTGTGTGAGTATGAAGNAQNLASYYAGLYQQALAGTSPSPALTPASTPTNSGITSTLLGPSTNPGTILASSGG